MENNIRQAYTDTFEHAFDEKGRITIPKEWRGDGFESRLHLMPSRDGCLKVYPGSFLARKQEELAASGTSIDDPKRKAFEKLAASIQALVIDQNNRVMIKEKFRSALNLNKKAVLVGCFDHFEIWHPDEQAKQGAEAMLEDIAGEAGL
jgi:MraZ protein